MKYVVKTDYSNNSGMYYFTIVKDSKAIFLSEPFKGLDDLTKTCDKFIKKGKKKDLIFVKKDLNYGLYTYACYVSEKKMVGKIESFDDLNALEKEKELLEDCLFNGEEIYSSVCSKDDYLELPFESRVISFLFSLDGAGFENVNFDVFDGINIKNVDYISSSHKIFSDKNPAQKKQWDDMDSFFWGNKDVKDDFFNQIFDLGGNDRNEK